MRSRLLTDPPDFSGAFPDRAAIEYYTSNSPLRAGGNPPAGAPVEIPLTPALTSEAVESLAAQSGPTSTVSLVAGGITINLLFDAAAMAAPASFRAAIQQAASLLTAAISDQITVNIKIDYSGSGGGAAAGPDNGLFETYSSVKANLINNATAGDTTFNALPVGSTIQGQTNVAVWNAQLKLWGILGANDTTTDDGSATFATDIDPSLLVGVALHELTHALGRVPYGPAPDVLDLFRFTSPGVHLFSGANTAPPAYFSLDGGNTKLADYGRTSDPSDFLNSGVQGSNDPFNEFYNGGTIQALSAADKAQLDALGFHTMMPVTPVVIEAFGSTSLVQTGSNYFLDSISTGSGPQLKYAGATVVAGQFGGYAPIGVEATGAGYEVAWKVAGVDLYSVWATDSNGNYTSNLVMPGSGTSASLEAIETSFHQDLNGDGTIGLLTTVIESFGSTSLVQMANNYFCSPGQGSTGTELRYGGAAVIAGQFGGYAPIGVEATGTGYEVAWKVAGVDQYSVWATDSNGNYTSNLVMPGSGTSVSLEAIETSFHQDLNGDGTIGIVAASGAVIEAYGLTSLVQASQSFFLDSISTGSGPQLKYAGATVMAGQFGGYAPIGVEATTTGYEVAWKVAGVDQYSVWATDSNGNYTSNLYMPGSGTGASLEALEPSFHQDLNGDGVIGIAPIVLEAFGSTSLVQTGSNYFLDTISAGSGPQLKYAGATVVAGQFGGYAPIGVEATATGYEVAWKVAGVDQYSVWATDSNGNYTSNLVMPGSGTSASLEAIETSFHQDLNGDGTIGIPTATHPAPVVLASADAFHFYPHAVPAAEQAGDSKEFFVRPTNAGLESLLNDPAATFQWMHNAYDPDAYVPVGHDHTLQKQAQISDLHATAVFIH